MYDKELLALVLSMEKWKGYLMGSKFVVCTGHASLQYLWELKIFAPQQEKWLIKLMAFAFTIKYKKGLENKVVDALSRQFEHLDVVTTDSTQTN